MGYVILRVAAGADKVADALAAIMPGWSDRVDEQQGWTTVALDRRVGERVASILERQLGTQVLVSTVPGRGPRPIRAIPAATGDLGMGRWRRQQRIRNVRGALHLFSGLGGIAIVGLIIRGPWLGIPVVLLLIAAMQVARFWLGWSLARATRRSPART